MANLNAKQRIFAREYATDHNATQAAIRAGYSAKTARTIGAQNLTKLDIREEVERLDSERMRRLNLSADFVLENIVRLAEEAQERGQFNAALRGYELLGKHLGLFTDKVEHSGKMRVKVSEMTDEQLAAEIAELEQELAATE